MQNVDLLEEVLSAKHSDETLSSVSEANPTPMENNEIMIPGLKLQLSNEQNKEVNESSNKRKRTEKLSAISDLMDKINKARTEEDLQSFLEVKLQLFNSDEDSTMVQAADNEMHPNQTAEGDVAPAKELDFSLPKLVSATEIDQETLNTNLHHLRRSIIITTILPSIFCPTIPLIRYHQPPKPTSGHRTSPLSHELTIHHRLQQHNISATLPASTENMSPTFLSTGNPCLGFLFNVFPDTPSETLVERLQLAWSHNPLTTLKLVCNLRGVRGTGKSDREGFYAAALWFHQHHPKTLASNVPSLADFVYFKDLPEILYRLLEGSQIRKTQKQEWTQRKFGSKKQTLSAHFGNHHPPSTGAAPLDRKSFEPPPSVAGRVASLRQLSNSFAQFSNLHLSLRSKKPLTRKDAATINEWRFSKLKEYKEQNVEAENEAFDRYMQNVDLLEEVLSTKHSDETLSSVSEANPTPMENTKVKFDKKRWCENKNKKKLLTRD
ncbi:hypothetical protein RYX36_017782 [Vicia faba]